MMSPSIAAGTTAGAKDCPICLNEMTESDLTYPLLCPSKCGYNFCTSCVDHLVQSSRCDYEMASDGNRHVKIQLQCPQCRGDLEHTIDDTLLLRKALVASRYKDMPDSELSASELRMKHDFAAQYADAVHDAEARLRKFHKEVAEGMEPIDMAAPPSSPNNSAEQESIFVDPTLFSGMEYAMSDAEQTFVTNLMTSGDVNQLAQAAQILHGITELSLQGLTPSVRSTAPTSTAYSTPSNNSTRRSALSSRSSVSLGSALSIGRTEQDRAERRKLEELERQKKRHPLPARMPRYVLLEAFNATKKKSTLAFVDDEWDGSIADAFTRVHSSKSIKKNNPGVDNILNLADDDAQYEPADRVKIHSVRGPAGKLGLQKGDIVTHINGEPFEGNAVELTALIASMYLENPEDPLQFSLLVNAEESTAQVLKLRAQACRMAMVEQV